MTKETTSIHEVKVYLALKSFEGKWASNHELSRFASGVSPRTIRAHVLSMVKLGMVEQMAVFPGHRYRLAEKADKRLVRRFDAAAEVFGLI